MTNNKELQAREEYLAFYHELGLAITQWAAIENSLFHVMAECFLPIDLQLLAGGFFAVENFRSKLRYVDTVFTMKFGQTPHHDDWVQLNVRITGCVSRRNALAHHQARVYIHGKEGRKYALIPWITHSPITRKKQRNPTIPKPPAGALFVRDIVRIRFEFYALAVSLDNFRSRIRGEPEMMPKSSEQPRNPPTIRSIRDQNHAILGLPLESSSA